MNTRPNLLSPKNIMLYEQYELLKQLIAEGDQKIIALQLKARTLTYDQKKIESTLENKQVEEWYRRFNENLFSFSYQTLRRYYRPLPKIFQVFDAVITEKKNYADMRSLFIQEATDLSNLVAEVLEKNEIEYAHNKQKLSSPKSRILQEQYEFLKPLINEGFEKIAALVTYAHAVGYKNEIINGGLQYKAVTDWCSLFIENFDSIESYLCSQNLPYPREVAALEKLIWMDSKSKSEYDQMRNLLFYASCSIAKLVGDSEVEFNIAYNKLNNGDSVAAVNQSLEMPAKALSIKKDAATQISWSPTMMRK